jgi:hypothetical protein
VKKILASLVVCLGILQAGCNYRPAQPTPDWKTYKFDEFNFSIDSPYKLVETSLPFLGKKNPNIVKMMAQRTELATDGYFCATLGSVNTTHQINVDLEKIGESSLKGFITLYVHPKYDTRRVTCSGIPAILTTGSGRLLFTDKRFLMLNTYKGHWWYQLNLQYLDKDPKGEEMAQKMLQSLNIKIPE